MTARSKGRQCASLIFPNYCPSFLHWCAYKFGLSISYNRVDGIQSAITDQVCREYQTKGLARPIGLSDSVFTTAAIDNIDHNASSSTSNSHFHRTSISVSTSRFTGSKPSNLV